MRYPTIAQWSTGGRADDAGYRRRRDLERSPKHLNPSRLTDVAVARHQRQARCKGGGDDEPVEGITGEAKLVGEEDLVGREIERLVGRIAEQQPSFWFACRPRGPTDLGPEPRKSWMHPRS
jgi:hypothetical protein